MSRGTPRSPRLPSKCLLGGAYDLRPERHQQAVEPVPYRRLAVDSRRARSPVLRWLSVRTPPMICAVQVAEWLIGGPWDWASRRLASRHGSLVANSLTDTSVSGWVLPARDPATDQSPTGRCPHSWRDIDRQNGPHGAAQLGVGTFVRTLNCLDDAPFATGHSDAKGSQ